MSAAFLQSPLGKEVVRVLGVSKSATKTVITLEALMPVRVECCYVVENQLKDASQPPAESERKTEINHNYNVTGLTGLDRRTAAQMAIAITQALRAPSMNN